MTGDEPTVSTKTKNEYVTQWKFQDAEKDKTMTFAQTSYCNNSYKPEIDLKYNKIDLGCKLTLNVFLKVLYSVDVNFQTNCGRARTLKGDYQVAQAGAGAHLATSEVSTQASIQKLGHCQK